MTVLEETHFFVVGTQTRSRMTSQGPKESVRGQTRAMAEDQQPSYPARLPPTGSSGQPGDSGETGLGG